LHPTSSDEAAARTADAVTDKPRLPPGGVPIVNDDFEVELEDRALLGEIELLTQLIIATAPFDHHLSTSQIDVALGLDARPGSDVDAEPARRAVDGS
jgi:hypothetical protein